MVITSAVDTKIGQLRRNKQISTLQKDCEYVAGLEAKQTYASSWKTIYNLR